MRQSTRGTLITGTDTGIGKTMISRAVAAALGRRGLSVGVYKPAETGCERINGEFVGSDCTLLAAAAGAKQTPAEVASYLFAMPAAPLVAAEAVGEKLEPLKIGQDYQALRARFDPVIVEGAGGLFVPIAERFTYLDLARQLELEIVVVVGSRLGCINHALLTFAAIRQAGLRMRGYVINSLEPVAVDDPITPESNRKTISRFTDENDIGLFPHVAGGDGIDHETLAGLAEKHLDLDVFV